LQILAKGLRSGNFGINVQASGESTGAARS
jgi:hypothetical protein